MFHRNCNDLRLSESGPLGWLARVHNRMVDELQRRSVRFGPGFRTRDDGTQGQYVEMDPVTSLASNGLVMLGLTQSDFTSGTTISVKPCDANGVVATGAEAIDVYVYAGGGSANLGSVTIAGTTASVSCKLATGKIIAYSMSDADAYMIGDVAQIIQDTRLNTSTQKMQAKVYCRVGIAVSTVSDWTDITSITSIQYAKLGADFTSGETVTLTPCSPNGTTSGASSVTVYLKWDKSSIDFSKDFDANTIDANLATNTVLSFVVASDGNRYVTSQPQCVVTKIDYSSDGIRTWHRWLVGGAQSTEGTTPVERVTFYSVTAHKVQWDAVNKKLQYREVTFRSPVAATEGAWTDLLDFECLSADTINSLTGSTGGGSYT